MLLKNPLVTECTKEESQNGVWPPRDQLEATAEIPTRELAWRKEGGEGEMWKHPGIFLRWNGQFLA